MFERNFNSHPASSLEDVHAHVSPKNLDNSFSVFYQLRMNQYDLRVAAKHRSFPVKILSKQD